MLDLEEEESLYSLISVVCDFSVFYHFFVWIFLSNQDEHIIFCATWSINYTTNFI